MSAMKQAGVDELVLASVERALTEGGLSDAVGWLNGDAAKRIPKERLAPLWYRSAKNAMALERWGDAVTYLGKANQLRPTALYQQRLHLVRHRREPALSLEGRGKLPKPHRLSPTAFVPELTGVVACGQYHSRGTGSGLPWSRLLRDAKDPPHDREERNLILSVAVACLCCVLQHEAAFLREVDVVVAIPPDPERYARRGMSLPDALAVAVEKHLAVPWLQEALLRTRSTELRGLSRAKRAAAVRDSMRVGNLGPLDPKSVLLVDDVITSGATLREAARLLKVAGVAEVYAAALSHTEG